MGHWEELWKQMMEEQKRKEGFSQFHQTTGAGGSGGGGGGASGHWQQSFGGRQYRKTNSTLEQLNNMLNEKRIVVFEINGQKLTMKREQEVDFIWHDKEKTWDIDGTGIVRKPLWAKN